MPNAKYDPDLERLRRYVNSVRAMGYNRDQIRQALITQGWSQHLINRALPPQKDWITAFLVTLAIALVAIFFAFGPMITGAFVVNGEEWENRLEIISTEQDPTVTAHIVFELYKPTNCSDGILVVDKDGNILEFKTENEIYKNGVCIETDVVFDNLIYKTTESTTGNYTNVSETNTTTNQTQSNGGGGNSLPPAMREENSNPEPPSQNSTSAEILPAMRATGAVIAQKTTTTYYVYYGKIIQEPEQPPTNETTPQAENQTTNQTEETQNQTQPLVGIESPALSPGYAGQSLGEAVLNSTSGRNLVSDNLTCYNTTSGNYTYHWIKNGESYESLILTFDQKDVPDNNEVIDSSGNGQKVCLGSQCGSSDSSDPAFTSSGKIRNAFSFDGSNDHIKAPNISNSALDLNVLTIEAWVYLPEKYNSSRTDNMMVVQAPAQYCFWFRQAEGRLRLADDQGEYLDSNKNSWDPGWYHIVGILDDPNNIKKIYINGELDNSDTSAFGIGTSCSGNAHCSLFIGARNQDPASNDNADGYWFNGTIDEVRIYPRVLSAEEIKAHYNLEYNKIVSNETSYNDRWRCDIIPTTSLGSSASLSIARSKLLLVNGIPNNTAPTLNYESGNYTCHNQTITDPDSGSINNVFTWYGDDQPLEALVLPFDMNVSDSVATSMDIQDYSPNNNTVKLSPRIYVSQYNKLNISFYKVNLPFDFVDPVVIAQPPTYNGTQTAIVRLRNVGHGSFEMRIQEAHNLDDIGHNNERVDYIVIERGAWHIPTKPQNKSALIQADYIGTSASVGNSISNNVWKTVNYTEALCDESMCYTPEVISQVQTIYDRHFVKTREKDVSGSYKFNVSLEEEEDQSNYHGPELIGYVAAMNTNGEITPDPYNAGTSSYSLYEFKNKTSVTDAWSTITYVNNYGGTVAIPLAGIKTYNGADSCELRKRNLGATSFQVKVEEDTANDSETTHGSAETVSYFAFSPGTLGNQRQFRLEPPETVAGKVGNALEFDGANDYLLINDSPSMRFRHNFTIEGWVKVLKNDETSRTIFVKNHNTSDFDIKITVSNVSLDCTIDNGTAQKSAAYNYGWGNSGTFYNQWKHFACRWNGTWLGVYVNGSLRTDSPQESYENTTGFGSLQEINASSYIGATRTADKSFDSFLYADLDEFRVYPYALTPEQIKAHYNLEYNKIVSSFAQSFNKLVCRTQANDEYTLSNAYNNTPIQIVSVNITPANPSTEDDLGCKFNITDPAAVWIKANVTWYNDTAHITGYDSTEVSCNSGHWCYATNNLQSDQTHKGDNITCEVTAYNDYGDTDQKNATVTINNTCPYWDPIPEDQTAQVGIMFTYDANATDLDNDTLTYGINDSSFTINSSTGEINKTFASTGNYSVKMNVTDGSCTAEVEFTIEVKKAAGDLCNVSSECGSGYCRHDWDWDGPKKICASNSQTCARSNSTGNFGNIPSEILFSTNIVDPDNTTISTEPFYKCREGHWSEDPYSNYINKSTYAEFTFDKAGSNNDSRIKINKSVEVTKATMELSGYLSRQWLEWYSKAVNSSEKEIYSVGVTKANGTIFLFWREIEGQNKTYYIVKSTDGGQTWTDPVIVFSSGITSRKYYSPVLIAQNSSNLYMVIGSDVDLNLTKSTDGGQTWSSPVLIDNSGSYYQVYSGIYAKNMPIIAFNLGSYLAVSNTTNGGNSFGELIHLKQSQYEWFEGGNPVIKEHSGKLYIIANKGSYGTSLFTSDDGYNWSYANDLSNSDNAVHPYIEWKGDRLYLIESREAYGSLYRNITMRYSDDNGTTWSSPTQVYADNVIDHRWPALFINDSEFYVLWRSQPTPSYYVHSSDNGTTWGSAVKLKSSDSFRLSVGRQYAIFYDNKFMIAGSYFGTTDSGSFYYSSLTENAPQIYPKNVTVDLGSDGINEFVHTGNLTEADSPYNVTLTGNLTELAENCNCSGCIDAGDYCDIAINVSVDGRGIIDIDDLAVTYSVPKPDLVPSEITYSQKGPLDQDSISVDVIVANQGDKNATQFNVSLYIDGSKVGENTISSLSTGSSTTTTFSNIWTAESEMHKIKAVVDSESEVDENNETNNNKTEMIGVDWPMFHQTDEHWGYSSLTGLPNASYLAWNYTGTSRFGEISITNNIVYVGSDDDHLYALNLSTGEQIWNFTASGDVRAAPVVYNGKLYFQDSGTGTHFYCLNATNGSQIWNMTICCGYGSPAVLNDYIYFAAQATMYAVNATNGSQIWNYSLSQTIQDSPAVYDEKVYFGSLDDSVYCLDAKTGTKIWNHSLNYDIYSSPAVDNGKIYIASRDNHKVYALNATNGSEIWNYQIPDVGYVYSSPAIYNDVLYIGSDSNKVYAINATNGSLIWSYTTGDDVRSSPIVADGKVYFGSRDNKFYALYENGTKAWDYTTTNDFYFAAAIGYDGTKQYVLISNDAGKVYAFGPQPPSVSNVQIQADHNFTLDDLNCTGTFSGGATPGNSYYKWFTNESGTWTQISGQTNQILDSNITNESAWYKCEIIPSDGSTNGTAVNSSALQIVALSTTASYSGTFNEPGNMTIASGGVLNLGASNVTISEQVSVSGTFNGGSGSHNFGSLTISGTYTTTSGTTTITGDTTVNLSGELHVVSNAVLNVTNVTHDGTTYGGDLATWHLYGEWKGTGTLDAASASYRTKLVVHDGSKIMGTLAGNSRYIYHFVIPDGATVTKYGNQAFGIKDGTLEINGTFAYGNGTRNILTKNLADSGDIVFGPNADVSQLTWTPVDANLMPESTWYSIFINNGGPETLAGNLTVVGNSTTSYIKHYASGLSSELNLSGYALIATGTNHNLEIGNNAHTSGYTGKLYLDSGTVSGFENITVFTDTSQIQDSSSGKLSASLLNVSKGSVSLSGTTVNITGDAFVSGTFKGGSGEDSFGSLTINSGGTYNATSSTTILNSYNPSTNRILDVQGTFNHNNGTVNITTTSTGKSITGASKITFYDLNLDSGTTYTQTWHYVGMAVLHKLHIGDHVMFRTDNKFIEMGVSGTNQGGEIVTTSTSYGTFTPGTSENITGVANIKTVWNGYRPYLGSSAGKTLYLDNVEVNYSWTTDGHGGTYVIKGDTDILGDLTVSSIGDSNIDEFNLDGGNLYVDGYVQINNRTSVNGYSNNLTTDTLIVQNGGTYNATSDTTIINHTSCGSHSILFYSGSTLNHNNGTFKFIGCGGTNWYLINPNIEFYNILVNVTGSPGVRISNLNVANDLTIKSGTLKSWYSTDPAKIINVSGDVSIESGTLDCHGSSAGDNNTYFGSLTINSGGTYDATNETTVTNDMTTSSYMLLINSGGTLNHNNGTFNMSEDLGRGHIALAGNTLYNVNLGGTNRKYQFDSNTHIEGNLTVWDTENVDGLDCGAVSITVDGIATFKNGSRMNNDGNPTLTFGALILESGSSFRAPSNVMTITSKRSDGFAFDCDGTFEHGNGTINFTTPSGTTYIDSICTGNPYSIEINNANYQLAYAGTYVTFEGNLTVNSGNLQFSNANGQLNVSGDAIVNGGTLGGQNMAGDWNFGSITIKSSGAYNATNGTTKFTANKNSSIEGNFRLGIDGGRVEDIIINGTKFNLSATNVSLHNVNSIPSKPADSYDIGKYVNLTNNSVTANALLNVSYSDGDLGSANESQLEMWKNNGSWSKVPDTGVYTTQNIVWANITSFSIFEPLDVNYAPGKPTPFYPQNSSIIYDLTPTLNWTIPTDSDGDNLHFQLQIANDSSFSQIVVNANSSADTTGFAPTPPVAQGSGNESYTVQNELDFRGYYWRVRAFDGKVYGNWSTTYLFNISTLNCLAIDDASMNFGSGHVTGDSNYAEIYSTGQATYNGTWSAVNDPFSIRNCGNIPTNITIKIDNADFMGGTGGKTWYNGTDDVSPGEPGTCASWGATENQWHEFTADNTYFAFCNNMSYSDNNNTIRTDLRLRIPSDATQSLHSSNITFNSKAI